MAKDDKKDNTLKLKFDSARNLAPAPESKSIAKIKPQYELFINGSFVKPESGKYFDTINPATEEKISSIAEANDKDVDDLVPVLITYYFRMEQAMHLFFGYPVHSQSALCCLS